MDKDKLREYVEYRTIDVVINGMSVLAIMSVLAFIIVLIVHLLTRHLFEAVWVSWSLGVIVFLSLMFLIIGMRMMRYD